jgi:ABC-type molybdate transport system substrate-binding protein
MRVARRVGLVTMTVAMIALLFLAARNSSAQSSGVRIMTSDGVEPALTALRPQIESSVARKLEVKSSSSKNLVDKIKAGEPFDVALLTTATIDDLVKAGKIRPDSRVAFARAGVGVGIRSGAPKVDISTPEAMKQALLNAKCITYNSTGATVAIITKMFETLGVTEALKSKVLASSVSGGAQQNVIDGKADMILILIPEVKGYPGLDYVGPLPGNLQTYINFVGGVATSASDPAEANTVIRAFSTLAGVAILRDRGMEPAAQVEPSPLLDSAALIYELPRDIKWVVDPNGIDRAILFGDPSKPGRYIVLARWHAHHMSAAHFHPNDRYILVVSGTWWVGTGKVVDPDKTVPMPAGTFITHIGKQVHFDGAKDEDCVLEITGEGPGTNIPFRSK